MYALDPISATQRWLEEIVIGLNLCPFARQPFVAGKVRLVVSTATAVEALLDDMQVELLHLEATPVAELETTIIVLTEMLANFTDYNDFLEWADTLIERMGFEGVFQIASFHPGYCFAGTLPSDVSNLTNRSPFPLLHILREDVLAAAIDKVPDVEAIPTTNIRRMQGLTPSEIHRLFSYLDLT